MRNKGTPKQHQFSTKTVLRGCLSAALQEAIPPKGNLILVFRERENFSLALWHGFHGKLKFNVHELVQSESEDTVLPFAHFGGHRAWHFEVSKNNVALDGSGGE